MGTFAAIRSTTSVMGVRLQARGRGQAVTDVVVVALGWAAIVVSAAILPVDDRLPGRAVLFLHLSCLPIAFGGVVLTNIYTLRWLLGSCRLADLLSLTSVAHPLMAVGLGGLIASGLALGPDLQATSMRVKLVLLLVIMVNAARMRQFRSRLEALDPGVAGETVPWSMLRTVMGSVVLSQAAWCGVIVVGFLTAEGRS